VHGVLGWAMLALAALHVAAALKHQLLDRDEVLANMVPGLPTAQPIEGSPARLATLGFGLGATTLLAAIALYTVFTFPAGAPAPPPPVSTFETVETTTSVPTPPPAAPSRPTTATTTSTMPPAISPPGQAAASTWRVNATASSVGFSFVYQDPENGNTTFNGRFTRWHANIRFDANDLAHSSAVVTIETGSATDGVDIHDRGLPAPEWFDAAGHPTAEFRTTAIRRQGDGYEAVAQLTIKGHTKTVTLPFTLSIDGAHASMRGHLAIDRRDFDIGVHSDANDMISQSVNISIRVDATRGS
jgi:cytochrome b561